MSSRTWACFDCRKTVRRDGTFEGDVPCPGCGANCTYVGYKTPIPPRRDRDAWSALRDQLQDLRRTELLSRHLDKVRRRHEIEQEIARLKQRPYNQERDRLIRQLEAALDDS